MSLIPQQSSSLSLGRQPTTVRYPSNEEVVSTSHKYPAHLDNEQADVGTASRAPHTGTGRKHVPGDRKKSHQRGRTSPSAIGLKDKNVAWGCGTGHRFNDILAMFTQIEEGKKGWWEKEAQGAAIPLGHLIFDADFEGGNLASAQRSDDGGEYEITLRHDTLNQRFRLWFHFRINNHVPGQRVVLTIVNFSKTRSLYKFGMTPVIRSEKFPEWKRFPPKDVYYYKSPKHGHNYVLSIVHTCECPGDEYEIAYSYPYSYTFLQQKLAWMEHLGSPFIRRGLLCRTPQLRRVDVLTISEPMARRPHPTSPPNASVPDWAKARVSGNTFCCSARRVVFISARVHPGETPASSVLDGLLDFLTSESDMARLLRREITWVVVPMLNPDGCFLGHYRTDAGGVDLNRLWAQASASLEPSIHYTLQLLKQYYDDPEFSLDVYIDIHAHSTSRTSFMYCNPIPALMANLQTMEQVTRLPRLVEAALEDLCFSPLKWDADPAKAGCARRVAGSLFPSTMCYTFEASFYSCPETKRSKKTHGDPSCAFASTEEGYREMGRRVAQTFVDYYALRPV